MVKTGMQNIEDIARIEYVLKNYDDMKNGSTIFATQNSDTSQEKTVILTKKLMELITWRKLFRIHTKNYKSYFCIYRKE